MVEIYNRKITFGSGNDYSSAFSSINSGGSSINTFSYSNNKDGGLFSKSITSINNLKPFENQNLNFTRPKWQGHDGKPMGLMENLENYQRESALQNSIKQLLAGLGGIGSQSQPAAAPAPQPAQPPVAAPASSGQPQDISAILNQLLQALGGAQSAAPTDQNNSQPINDKINSLPPEKKAELKNLLSKMAKILGVNPQAKPDDKNQNAAQPTASADKPSISIKRTRITIPQDAFSGGLTNIAFTKNLKFF